MVARICLLLFFLGGLVSCRSAPAEQPQPGRDFGPVKILLYAEIRDATYGWLGDPPVPANIEAVTYTDSANFKALERAIAAAIEANGEGQHMAEGQHKAVSAIVTAQRIKQHGMPGVQILSSESIEIVELPTNLYEAWKAAGPPPN